MRWKIFVIIGLAIVVLLVGAAPQETATREVMLDIPLQLQETALWCWAASTQMILKYMGQPLTQCEQANRQFVREDCCESDRSWRCVDTSWPRFYEHGFTSDSIDGALSWQQLKAELDAKRPIAFSWEWKLGGGHMMVAVGYSEPDKVYVNDPWDYVGAGETRDQERWQGDLMVIPYKEYVEGEDHTHWRDYFNIRPKREPEQRLTRMPETAPDESPERVVSREPVVTVSESPSVVQSHESQPENNTAPTAEEVSGASDTPATEGEFVEYDRQPKPRGGFQAIQKMLQYPDQERQQGIEGKVTVNVLVTETGEAAATEILSSSGNENLDSAAIETLTKIEWEPAMQGDKPVKVWVAVPVSFSLRR